MMTAESMLLKRPVLKIIEGLISFPYQIVTIISLLCIMPKHEIKSGPHLRGLKRLGDTASNLTKTSRQDKKC